MNADALESVELAAGAARVIASPALGGCIVAFDWRGIPVLRPTPREALIAGNVRLTACYPLVPHSNRIRDATLAFAGALHRLARNSGDHPHAIHGVGWQRAWTVDTSSATRASMTLDHVAEGAGAAVWPWAFRAVQTFDLAVSEHGALLCATLTIENTGTGTFPFGLGWHPFFPRDATTTLAFSAQGVWLNDPTQLPVERVATAAEWSFEPARALGDVPLDNVFCGFGGRATLSTAGRPFATTLEADSACRCLVVYAPQGRDFVAVEPVTHETDAFNRAAQGAADTGMRTLQPGAAFSCTMRVGVAEGARWPAASSGY